MEKITEEELKNIFPVSEDQQKNLRLSSKDKKALIEMFDILEEYAAKEVWIAQKSRDHWLINYDGTVEETKEQLDRVREWVEHFKNKLGD